MAGYVCKHCGAQSATSAIAGGPCSKSPTSKHVIIRTQPKYVCKYCGFSSSTPSAAGGPCDKSPHKRHELLDA